MREAVRIFAEELDRHISQKRKPHERKEEPMNKKEIIDFINRITGVKKKDIEDVLVAFSALVNTEERVAYPGFGVFKRKIRPAGKKRNPATGEMIDVPEKAVVRYKPSEKTFTMQNLKSFYGNSD